MLIASMMRDPVLIALMWEAIVLIASMLVDPVLIASMLVDPVLIASMTRNPVLIASMLVDPVLIASMMRDPVLVVSMTLHHEKTATFDEESDEDSMAETRLSREKTTSDSASSPLLSGPERRRGEEMQDVALDLEVPKQSLKPCLEEIWL